MCFLVDSRCAVDIVHHDGGSSVEKGNQAEDGGGNQHHGVEAEPCEVDPDPVAEVV